MSSFKKASKLNQKTHRERAQPKAREKLGLLEKKKDYKVRAQDRNEKEETIKLLRKKALNKNPDEFYHHMINSKIQKDEHFEKDKEEDLTPEQIKLMETQDSKYINMKRVIERKKIQRLQSQLHFVSREKKVKNKHIFFVDDMKEAQDLNETFRATQTESKLSEEATQLLNQERDKSYKELEKRKERERELAKIQRKMLVKNLTKKQRIAYKPKELQEVAKSSHMIFKFKYQRKK
ncbi:probable U3 small nucleolar RNA-associated protein 11 [Chironomus tepperi]|uniref:probable U3 small nucleolar RNA-associated protein 11 n=1 Tax=Chironomus tepperi TaxID=113505 RepID=UPI00391F0E21